MITGLEVLDTAVKIGLGALISALGGLAVARHTHQSGIKAERFRRRATLLESVAEDIQSFANAALRQLANVGELVNCRMAGVAPSPELDARLIQSWDALYAAFEFLVRAEAKLLLIGAKPTQQLVREYGEDAQRVFSKLQPANANLKASDLEPARSRLLAARNAAFDSLGRDYDRQIG